MLTRMMDDYDAENVNKQLPIKTHVGKMESIIDNLSKYLEMLKSEILNKIVSDEAYKIEQQFEVIFQCFNDLQKEVISVVDNHSREEADTLSNASEETVGLDMTPENIDDESSALVNVSAIKKEVFMDNSSTLDLAVIGEIEHTEDNLDNSFEQESGGLQPNHSSARRSGRLPKRKSYDDDDHACDYCLKVFSTSLELDDHMETHTNGHLFCKECGKRFDRMSNLTRHISKVHPDNDKGSPYKCSICVKGFTEESAFKKHMEIHRDIHRPFKCEQCTKCFPQAYLLREHQLVHAGVRAFKCPEPGCEKRFIRKKHVNEHITRTHKKKLKCTFCVLYFQDRDGLIEHVSASHESEKISLESMKFDKIEELGNKETLKSDQIEELGNQAIKSEEGKLDDSVDNEEWNTSGIKSKSTPKIKKYKCDECGKLFRSPFEVAEHKPIHTGDLPYKCDVCLKPFLRRRFMMAHRRKHAEPMDESESPPRRVSKKPSLGNDADAEADQDSVLIEKKKPKIVDLKCTYCFEEFESLEDLKTHARTTHPDIERRFKCKECGKCFRTRYDLERHKRTHTGETPPRVKTRKPYICDYCGKILHTKGGLDRHVKGHTGEGLYPCEICERSYPSAPELKYHMKAHTNERAFQCEECGKAFFTNHHLKDHMTTHSELKQYQCSVCGNGFTRKTGLRDHMKTHTGEGMSTCVDCGKSFTNVNTLKNHRQKINACGAYDPDRQCGVWIADRGKQCKRSLACKLHCLSMKRTVQGRRKSFDQLLQEHRYERQAREVATCRYDPERHCGVWIADEERHCIQSLACKAHSLSLRRAVPGRTKSFDQLLQEDRYAKEAQQAIKGVYDPERHCGVWLADQDKHCTMSLGCKTHPLSQRRAVPGRSKVLDQLLQEYRERKRANQQATKADDVYDPEWHCGVWNQNQARHCMQTLECKIHSLPRRQAVPRPNKSLNQLLQEHRAANESLQMAHKDAINSSLQELGPTTFSANDLSANDLSANDLSANGHEEINLPTTINMEEEIPDQQ